MMILFELIFIDIYINNMCLNLSGDKKMLIFLAMKMLLVLARVKQKTYYYQQVLALKFIIYISLIDNNVCPQ